MPEKFNFEDEVTIDLDNLHTEFQNHAQVRRKYADEVSHLEKVAKKAHENVMVTRSRLTKEAKEQGCSNAALQEAYYRGHEDHISAKNEMIEKEYQLSMSWNALKAFDDRKTALENEVKLWGANYFASPTEERQIEPGKSIVDKSRDETTQKVRAGMNRRKRKEK